MPIFSDLKILKLHDLFQLKMLRLVYDCINKIAPFYFHSFFELVDSFHSTRQATKIDIFLSTKKPCKMVLGLQLIRAKCWSDIHMEIKSTFSQQIMSNEKSAKTIQHLFMLNGSGKDVCNEFFVTLEEALPGLRL